jgi:hypothetical protein
MIELDGSDDSKKGTQSVDDDVNQLLAKLRAEVETARSMPMSASALISRADVLAQIDAIAAALPQAFAQSDEVYSKRDQLVGDAQAQADRIVVEATNERDRLVSDSEVYRVAKHEADEERARAERECEALRHETDEYVDGRLAHLEITLTKTLEAVTRGRERLHGRSDLERLEDLHGDDDFTFPGSTPHRH